MSCPICQKPTDPSYRPFCSNRCANVDLAHWLRGSYAIPDDTLTVTDDDADTALKEGQKPH